MDHFSEYQNKEVWEQWPDETDTAFHRFSIYLQMGPKRTQQKVVEELGKSRGYEKQLQKWSSRYNWVERCREYDNHVVKQSLKNKQEIIDHARGRLLQKVDESLDVVLEVMRTGTKDVEFNLAQKLKAAQYILETAGLVAPDSEVKPGKNIDDATYIQNIYDRINKHYGRDGADNN